jgi:hypothetical protein
MIALDHSQKKDGTASYLVYFTVKYFYMLKIIKFIFDMYFIVCRHVLPASYPIYYLAWKFGTISWFVVALVR